MKIDDLLHGDWDTDTDTDDIAETDHTPKCSCDDCDPLTVELDPDEDINSPEYHAPNMCKDPTCDYIQCQDSGAVGTDPYPGENIWWKTNDNWNNS